MSRPTTTPPILVVGGTGKTGRRVAARLSARGLPVRVGSRSGDPPFDWHDPETWVSALQGARSAYVTYHPDLAVPGAVAAIRRFAEVAIASGVPRIVLLSGRGEEAAQQSEQALVESGADWTIVRTAWFSQNFSESYVADAVSAGEVALPVGYAGEPFIDVEDIADVAVEVLTGDGHVGRLYELTGPRLLTFADAVAEIAKATGREIRYTEVPTLEYAAALEAQGLPTSMVALVLYLFREVMDGRNAWTTDGVREVLGRAPRDFADYAGDAAAAGAWGGGTSDNTASDNTASDRSITEQATLVGTR